MDKKIVFFTSSLFCFALPLSTKFANMALFAFIISIVYYKFKARENKLRLGITLKQLLFQTTGFLILLLTIGLLFTEDRVGALKFYGRYSSYLLVPVFLSLVDVEMFPKIKRSGFRGLIIGATISGIYLLCFNFYKYFNFKGRVVVESDLFGYNFTYHEFTTPINMHPTFLGLYLVLSFVGLCEFRNLFKNYLRVIIGALLIITLVFLNSRVPFIAFLVYLVMYFCRLLLGDISYKVKIKRFLLIFGGSITVVMLLLVTLKNTYFYQRFSNHIIWELSINKGTSYDGVNANDSRLSRWVSITKKGFEKPIFGYGSGSDDKIAIIAYEEERLEYALQNRYGPHNQFLSIFIDFGLFGLFICLYYFGYNIYMARKQYDFIGLFFFLITSFACIFDSLLYLNAGVIFFAFFGNMFTIELIKKRDI